MTPEEMRKGAEAFYDAMNRKDIDFIRENLADDFVEYQEMPGIPPTKEGVIKMFEGMFAAMPDARSEIIDTVVSGNKIAIRGRFSATQTGEFMGMPATNKPFSIEAMDIVEVTEDGKSKSHSGVMDAMGMMMQVGLIPSPE
ncbi:MAG: ester cyclase [Actinomycetota bacterium]